MSLHQTAFIAKERVPNRSDLQATVQKLGFDLTIDDFYKPFGCSGFLPCNLNGEKSGFEIYFGLSEEELQQFPHRKEAIGNRDSAITFRWGSRMDECACVMIVSAALANDHGAVVLYQDDDIIYSLAELIAGAKETLLEVQPAAPSLLPPPTQPTQRSWWKFWT